MCICAVQCLDDSYLCVFLPEHDPLLYMVYEHGSATDKSLEPYLWTYRSRITLEHLALLLQPQQDKYRILAEFLKQVMNTLCPVIFCMFAFVTLSK